MVQEDEPWRSMFAWLVSLRISQQDARKYADALRAFGFDDMQSLHEDVTEEDLFQAGMKPGHVRRISKALRALEAGANAGGINASAANVGDASSTSAMRAINDIVANSRSGRSNHESHDRGINGGGVINRRENQQQMDSTCERRAYKGAEVTKHGLAEVENSTTCHGTGLVAATSRRGGENRKKHRGKNVRHDAPCAPQTAMSGEAGHFSSSSSSWAPYTPGHAPLDLNASRDTDTFSASRRTQILQPEPGAAGALEANPAISAKLLPTTVAIARSVSKAGVDGESVARPKSPQGQDEVRSAGIRVLAPPPSERGLRMRGHRSTHHLSPLRTLGCKPPLREDGGVSLGAESDHVNEVLEPSPSSGESSSDTAYPVVKNDTATAFRAAYRDPPQGRLGVLRELGRDQCPRGSPEHVDENSKFCCLPLLTSTSPSIDKRLGGPTDTPGGSTRISRSHDLGDASSTPMRQLRPRDIGNDHRSTSSLESTSVMSQAPFGPDSRSGQVWSGESSDKRRLSSSAGVARASTAEPAAGRRGSADMIGCGHVKTLQRIRSTGRVGVINKFDSRDGLDAEGQAGIQASAAGTYESAGVRRMSESSPAEVPEDIERPLEVHRDMLLGSYTRCSMENAGLNLSTTCSPDREGRLNAAAGEEIEDDSIEEVPEEIDLSMVMHGEHLLAESEAESACSFKSDLGRMEEESPAFGVERWGMPAIHPGSADDGDEPELGNNAEAGRLSLDLSILSEQHIERSYEFSDSGTLHIQGFVLKPDGMKSAPGTNDNEELVCQGTTSSDRASPVDKSRYTRPPSLQMTFDTDDRTPLSRDSFFGRALSTNRWGYRAVGSRERGEESSGRARSHVADGVSTPLLSVSTPRPMRETIILLEEIGRGGGGTVHKAMHVPSMRLVAVKMMEVHDDEKRRQMIKEIKALHSMNRVPLPAQSNVVSDEYLSAESLGHCGSCDNAQSLEWSSDSTVNTAECFTCKTAALTPSATVTRTVTPYSRDRAISPFCTGTTTPSSSMQSSGVGIQVDRGNDQCHTLERPESSCGFPPGSRSSVGGAGVCTCNGSYSVGTSDHTTAYGENDGSCAKRWGTRRQRERKKILPVVAFHDAYTETEHGCVCMVMEYMDGGTLQQFISKGQALSEPFLAVVARSVLRGLVEMHSRHQLHRDIKPSNILVDRHGRVKISDFGVVRDLTRTDSLASTFTGTLVYMSPERITESDYSYPSDVWSLGLVIIALALGRFPLSTRGGYFEMVQAIANDPIPELSPTCFSMELCGFVEFMLRRDPAERATARALLQHPFLQNHRDSHTLVDIVKVAPATRAQVRSLLQNVVDFHLEATRKDRGYVEKDFSFTDGAVIATSTPASSLCSGCSIPQLWKGDFAVLASQLQVTRTKLVQEYEHLRKRAVEERVDGNHRLFPGAGQPGSVPGTVGIYGMGGRLQSTTTYPTHRLSVSDPEIHIRSPACPRGSIRRGVGNQCGSPIPSSMVASDAPRTMSTVCTMVGPAHRLRRGRSQGGNSLSGTLRAPIRKELCIGERTNGLRMAQTIC